MGLQPRAVEVPPNGGQEQPVQVWGNQDVVVVFSYAFNFLNELQVYGLLAYGHDAPAVPHFDSEKNYRKILEPGWELGARRSHLKVQEATEAEQMEDWMRIFEAPRPQRRRRGKGRGAGRGASRRLP